MASQASGRVVSGTFDATGDEIDWPIHHQYNGVMRISLTFGTGTVLLQESIDGGATWTTAKTYTASAFEIIEKGSPDYLYTLKCSVHSVDIVYSLGN